MALKLVVSPTVVIALAGTITNSAGLAMPFSCSLTCDRLPAEALRAELDKKTGTTTDFVRKVVRGWDDVTDEQGELVPFSKQALEQFLSIPGIAKVAFDAYFEGCGAKAKN